MKNIHSILFFLLILSSLCFSQGWVLEWSDEFNGEELDESSWNIRVANPNWVNGEDQRYTAGHDQPGSNIFVEGGNLIIECRREDGEITSGRINGEDKRLFKHGRLEARARLPVSPSYWPAFWMQGWDLNHGVGWPTAGEIDIMEGKGSQPTRTSGAFHCRFGTPVTYGNCTLPSGNVHDKYHVYAIEWTADTIKWFVDDDNFHTWGKPNDEYPIDKDYYFLINLAIGGHFDGPVTNETVFPESLIVDWVRVSKWDPTAVAAKEQPKMVSVPLDFTVTGIEASRSLVNVSYDLKKPSEVEISLHTIDGRSIGRIYRKRENAGSHTVSLGTGGEFLTNGVYIVSLSTESSTINRKISILR